MSFEPDEAVSPSQDAIPSLTDSFYVSTWMVKGCSVAQWCKPSVDPRLLQCGGFLIKIFPVLI